MDEKLVSLGEGDLGGRCDTVNMNAKPFYNAGDEELFLLSS